MEQPLTKRSWLIAVLLGLAGLGLNALPVHLFYRVDFIFGSVATLVAVAWLGGRAGLLATLIAGAYTFHLWGHPYAWVILAAETVFVSWLLRRGTFDLIFADALFWVGVGMPLVILFYGGALQLEGPATALIMLKQAVNGILNALLAALIRLAALHFFHVSARPLTLRQWLAIPIAGLVLVPSVLLTIVEGRSELRRVEELARQRLELSLRHTEDHIQYLYSRRITVIADLARHVPVENGRIQVTPALVERLRIMKGLFAEFHNLYVADAAGTAVAFFPETNERGESPVGHNFADRAYYQQLTNTLAPVLSDVFLGRGGVFVPIQTVNVPILRGNEFLGYASGALDLNGVRQYLLREVEKSDLQLTLLDRHGRVVASTSSEKPLQELSYPTNELAALTTPGLYLLAPRGAIPQLQRFQRSWYVASKTFWEGASWRVVGRVPVAPYQSALAAAYIDNLAITLSLVCGLLLVGRLVIRYVANPFLALTTTTHDLPGKLVGGARIDWPASGVAEFNALIENLKQMSRALQGTFTELRQNTEQLSAANTELQSEVARRQRTEEFLREQNQVLLDLARVRGEWSSLEEALHTICEAAARVLGVARVSVWFFDPARTKIVCQNLFETTNSKHSAGMELHATRYPAYFRALNTERVIAANDALVDSRTAEFAPDYLRPLGIGAMLDAPIWVRGHMLGVVCHEHVGAARVWTSEEQAFAGAIADLVTLACEEHERKSAQQALARSEESYRRIVDTAREGIWMVDADYCTTFVNKRMAELLGYEPGEMMGRRVPEFLFPEDLPAMEERIRERKVGTPGHYDFRYRRKDGSEIWVLSSIAPIQDASGKFKGALGMFTDITERRNVERERLALLRLEQQARLELEKSDAALREAQRKLQQHAHELEQRVQDRTARLAEAVAQMEAFSYTVSHDLRAPLRALSGYANLLEEDYGKDLPAEALEHIERIRAGAHRLDRLTQDVLMYSRVGRQDLQMERVDLEHLVDDIVAQYPEFSKFVRVEKPLAAVMGSEALLTQCLSNLIGNAVKFTKPGELPEVRVRNELRDGFVRVWVEDKGIGIDPRYHQKIFAAFERVETSGAYEGTGIGLAIVQKGVERMGGQVGVVSEPGRGSAFWIELPRAEP